MNETRTYMEHDITIMSTGTNVRPSDPDRNNFGHSLDDSTFLVLESASRPGRSRKIVSSAGSPDGFREGEVVRYTIDTGHGLRKGSTARIVGIVSKDFKEGVITTRKLPYWVFK